MADIKEKIADTEAEAVSGGSPYGINWQESISSSAAVSATIPIRLTETEETVSKLSDAAAANTAFTNFVPGK